MIDHWIVRLALTGALVVSVGGCSPSDDSQDPSGESLSGGTSTEAVALGLTEELAAARAAELGIDNPPAVVPISAITPDAAGLRIKTQCMIDKGYPYEFDDPSGETVSIDMHGIDQEQFNLDTYVCEMQYPVEQRFQRPLGEREWGILYDHYVNTYIPCVENLGYSVEPPPSRDVYISKALGGELPYSPALEVGPQVMEGVDRGLYESVDDFHRSVCPDTVSLDVLYPPE